MNTSTDLHDQDLERALRELLRTRADEISGPPPALPAAPPPPAVPAPAPGRRRWLAAAAVVAVLAAAGYILSGGNGRADEVVATDGGPELVLDPRPADPVVLGPFGSSDVAVRSFLERTVGVEATGAAAIEEGNASDIAPGTSVRHVPVTLSGGDPFTVRTLLRDGSWYVTGSDRALQASRPVLLEAGDQVELLFAHPHDADRVVVWYVDADGRTLEAAVDRDGLEAGRRVLVEEVATLIAADGFTPSQSRDFAERLADRPESSTMERSRVRVPGSVDLSAPVVVASFDSEGRPLAVWTDGALDDR